MKIFIFIVLFCAIAGVYSDDPKAVSWEAKDDKNNTCFMADMGVQWHVTYVKTDKEATKIDKLFTFDDPSELSAVECNASRAELRFMNKKLNQNLTLVFTANNESYSLTSATLSYYVSNETFPNATNLNATVTASMTDQGFFSAPVREAYTCSIETQFRLKSSQPGADTYLRFIPPTNKTMTMQAVTFSDNGAFGNQSDCFWDMPRDRAAVNTYKITNSKKEVCAIVKSSLEIEVEYMPIAGNTSMKIKIPVPADAATSASGSCEKNRTTMNIMVKDVGNVTLGFSVTSEKKEWLADTMVSVLDTFSFEYDTKSQYFPNNGATSSSQMESNSKLSMFETPTGMSYNCDGITMLNVTNSTKATFNQTTLQAFDIEDGTFSNQSRDCQASNDSTTATPPVTTTPAIKPEPDEPPIYNTTIMDKNVTCLHALLGLQLRVSYVSKHTKNLTEYFFNYDVRNNASEATCGHDNKASVSFRRKDYGQVITLQFLKDSTTNSTYLSSVTVTYDKSKLPNGTETEKGNVTHISTMQYFKVPFAKSYACDSETDILLNSTDMTTVRMTGLKLEAFPAKKGFAPASRCFREMTPPPSTTGTYYINSTLPKKTDSICAVFKLAVAVNVSYVQLIDPNPKQVYIAINGTDNAPGDGSFGMCGINPNETTLEIPLDGGKVKFIFVFTKTNFSGSDFDYAMTKATMIYSTDSKYFPNHEYVEGGNVTLTSKTLKMFASDQDHSYKCNKNATADIMGGKQSGTISFAQVQVQPFGVASDGTFKSAEDCAADNTLSKAARIGILCAIVVVGLALIVGAGCFCRRKYKQKNGYTAFA